MRQHDTHVDAVVIGGGLAGLAAAAFLARAGRAVTVCEAAAFPGGRARTTDADGWRLNLGPHALFRRGAAHEVLSELGVPVAGHVPGASGAYALRAGGLHTLPTGAVSVLTTGLLRPREKLEFGRLVRALPHVDTTHLQGVTIRQWLDETVAHEAVRELLQMFLRVATYADAPAQVSAGAALDQFALALGGVLYVDDGWDALVSGLRAQCAKAGVTLRLGQPVRSVVRDPAVRGVQLADGTVITAPVVVVASSPAVAHAVTACGEDAPLAAAARSATPARMACLDVALCSLPRPHATFAAGVDEPLYLSVHSTAARLAPAGGAVIHVAQYGTTEARAPEVRARLEGLLDRVQPGWRDVLAHARFLPTLTASHALVTAAQHGTAGRPGPAVPEVPGLFIVGDWVGSRGMLADAALASARLAAHLILLPQKEYAWPRVDARAM